MTLYQSRQVYVIATTFSDEQKLTENYSERLAIGLYILFPARYSLADLPHGTKQKRLMKKLKIKTEMLRRNGPVIKPWSQC